MTLLTAVNQLRKFMSIRPPPQPSLESTDISPPPTLRNSLNDAFRLSTSGDLSPILLWIGLWPSVIIEALISRRTHSQWLLFSLNAKVKHWESSIMKITSGSTFMEWHQRKLFWLNGECILGLTSRSPNFESDLFTFSFDSIQDGSVAICTPHTGFSDPTTPEGTPLRQSIELRALVFYDWESSHIYIYHTGSMSVDWCNNVLQVVKLS